jgi:catalase (peroxidase I)
MEHDYDAVRQDIKMILPNTDWDDSCFLGPVLVRLSWHSAGTYDKASGTGGSVGATMRFKPESADPENAGLDDARYVARRLKIGVSSSNRRESEPFWSPSRKHILGSHMQICIL